MSKRFNLPQDQI